MTRRTALASLALLLLPALALADAVAGGSPSIWLPAQVSQAGHDIDALYMNVMVIVAVIFVATEGLLLYSIIAFRAKPGRRAQYFHGSTGVELVLAAVPALILLYITVTSSQLWDRVRLAPPKGADVVHIQVYSEQFAWNFRYPGPDAAFGTKDDVMVSVDAAVPVGKDIVFHLSSKDVIHSFFLPESRVKQDLVPGLLGKVWTRWDLIPVWDLATQQRVLLTLDQYRAAAVATSGYTLQSEPNPVKRWFQASDSAKINYLHYHYERDNDAKLVVEKGGKPCKDAPQYVLHYYEIGCAQLCGNLHFAMRGTMKVLPPEDYEAWLKAQQPDSSLADKWNGIWDKYHPEFNKIL
jgi:heme/copper-type cytochrome/quinol oxidase subunit 2